MVLIKNNGEKDAILGWESSHYVLRPGETQAVGGSVARAFERRYPDVRRVQTDDAVDGVESEEIVQPEAESESVAPETTGELLAVEPMEVDAGEDLPPPPQASGHDSVNKLAPGHVRNEARKNRNKR